MREKYQSHVNYKTHARKSALSEVSLDGFDLSFRAARSGLGISQLTDSLMATIGLQSRAGNPSKVSLSCKDISNCSVMF